MSHHVVSVGNMERFLATLFKRYAGKALSHIFTPSNRNEIDIRTTGRFGPFAHVG